MPISRPAHLRRICQEEFSELAYEVMGHVHDIHNDFGRFFDERVYKRELADRMPGLDLEVPVTVTYLSFVKTYQLDVLARQSGLFEFKVADRIISRHKSQTLNYLLLCDLAHGLIVNMRPDRVGREFVNCRQRLENLRAPSVECIDFDPATPGSEIFQETLVALIQDWGVGLELGLYEEAMIHTLGGEELVTRAIPVAGSKGLLHYQKMRLAADDVAFKITALSDESNNFESHARRLLKHTTLNAIHWANLTMQKITFRTLRAEI